MDQSRFDRHRWLGWSAWGTGAFPLTRSGQLLGQLRYDERKAVAGTSAAKSLHFGARAFLGSATFNAFAEVVGNSQLNDAARATLGDARWSAGVEFRAGDQLWLSTGVGNSAEAGSDHALVIAGLRWNVLDRPRFGGP